MRALLGICVAIAPCSLWVTFKAFFFFFRAVVISHQNGVASTGSS